MEFMLKRELNKRQKSHCLLKRLHSERARITSVMTSAQKFENLEKKLDSLMGQLREKDQELGQLQSVDGEATSKFVELRRESDERVLELEHELAEAKLQGEIIKFRAFGELHNQHRLTMEKESERMNSWIKDLKNGHCKEKTYLLERIAELKKKASVGFGEGS